MHLIENSGIWEVTFSADTVKIGSSYKYKVTGSSLTLTSSDLMEEQVYDKASLPEGIKVNTDTKSAETAVPITVNAYDYLLMADENGKLLEDENGRPVVNPTVV